MVYVAGNTNKPSNYIEWKGGNCPFPSKTSGILIFKCGIVHRSEDISQFEWRPWCDMFDIVAYYLTGKGNVRAHPA